MRRRKLVLVIAAAGALLLLAVGCDMNPQPEVPSDDEGSGGEAGSTSANPPGPARGNTLGAEDPDPDYASFDQPGPPQNDQKSGAAERSDSGTDAASGNIDPGPPREEDAGPPPILM